MKESKAREVWVDVSRVLAMFFVVYMHTPQFLPTGYESKWTGIILSPSFDASSPCTVVLMYFFLSGWLKRARNRWLDFGSFLFILGPLAFWNIVVMVIDPSVWEWRWTLPLEILFAWHQYNPPLWFLRDFAVLSLIYPLIMRISVKVRFVIVLIGLSTVELYGFNYQFAGIPLVVTYFLLGTLTQSLFEREQVSRFVRKYSLAFCIISLVFVYRSLLFGWLPDLPMSNKVAMYGIMGLLALLSYGAAIEQISSKVAGWCASLAPAVFTVYVSHYPMIVIIRKVSEKYDNYYLDEKLFPLYAIACYVMGLGIWYIAKSLPIGILGEWITMQKRSKNK